MKLPLSLSLSHENETGGEHGQREEAACHSGKPQPFEQNAYSPVAAVFDLGRIGKQSADVAPAQGEPDSILPECPDQKGVGGDMTDRVSLLYLSDFCDIYSGERPWKQNYSEEPVMTVPVNAR